MMKKIIFTTITIATLILFCSCPKEEKEETEGSIVGFVSDENNHELQGAKITLFDQTGIKESVETGSDGRYEFQCLPLGKYMLTAELNGYHSDTTTYSSDRPITVDREGIRADFVLKEIALRLDKTTIEVSVNNGGEFIIHNDSKREMTWKINKNYDWIILKTEGKIQAHGAEDVHISIDQDKLPISIPSDVKIVINSSHEYETLTLLIVKNKDIQLNTRETTTVGSTATFKGEIIEPGSPRYKERGFVYSSSPIEILPNGMIKDETLLLPPNCCIPAITEDAIYEYEKKTLPLGEYYVRAFAKNDLGYKFGNEVPFTITAIKSTLSTQFVSKNIGIGTATFSAIITSQGDFPIKERGFVYSLSPNSNPTIENAIKKEIAPTTFRKEIEFIEGNIYYVRAYVIDENGVLSYDLGEAVKLDFIAVTPKPTTQAVSDISKTSATLHGSIDIHGDPKYISKGFVYGTNTNPKIENSTHWEVGGKDSGKFTWIIPGTDPKYALSEGETYYVNTYVIYPNEKIMYGEVPVNFTTPITITGMIKDNNGIGINGAIVRFKDSNSNVTTETQTNNSGTFTIQGIDINSCYFITITAAGYSDYGVGTCQNFLMSQAMNDIKMNPSTGKLTVTFRDEKGMPMKNMEVALGTQTPQYTNAAGEVSFSELKIGTYRITAHAENYEPIDEDMTINGNETKIYEMTPNYIVVEDIMVQKEDRGAGNYAEAVSLCEEIGWRLPIKEELYDVRNIATNLEKSNKYWSSSPKTTTISLPCCPTCPGSSTRMCTQSYTSGYYYLENGNVESFAGVETVANVRCVRDMP